MPIKKGQRGERRVEMDVIVPGTPEQVWNAMATGPGSSAWFTRTTIDGRVGGEIQFDMGAYGKQTAEVTAWEPPHRFAYVEREWSEGAPPVATEITITARSGDRCVMRMVHSLFASTDDWDDQLEGFEQGWPAFFEVLRLYLAHFAGSPGAAFSVMEKVAGGEHLAVWKQMVKRMGLAGADVDERWTSSSTPEPLSAVVERIDQQAQQRYLLLRSDAPGDGIVLVGTYATGEAVNVSVTVYCYGADADQRAAASEPQWRRWLQESVAADAVGEHDRTAHARA